MRDGGALSASSTRTAERVLATPPPIYATGARASASAAGPRRSRRTSSLARAVVAEHDDTPPLKRIEMSVWMVTGPDPLGEHPDLALGGPWP